MVNRTDQDHTRHVGDRTAPATTPNKQSIREDRKDLDAEHKPDRAPTAEEEAIADRHGEVAEDVASAYEEALERGASQKGEGRPGV